MDRTGSVSRFIGVSEAEAITSISRWTWRRWAYDGKVESVKLGKRLLIPVSEIDRLVAKGRRHVLSDGTATR
jgi:excisionase family DNA binding protein